MKLYYYCEDKITRRFTNDGKLLTSDEAKDLYVDISGILYNKKTTPNLIEIYGGGWAFNNGNFLKVYDSHVYVSLNNATLLVDEDYIKVLPNRQLLDNYLRSKNRDLNSVPYGLHKSNLKFISKALKVDERLIPNHIIFFISTKVAEDAGFTLTIDREIGYVYDAQYAKDRYELEIKRRGYIPPIFKPNNTRSRYRNPPSKKDISMGVFSPTFLMSEGLQYKFGVEIETNSGIIYPHTYYENNLNLQSTKDGSITGGEYVTGVLQGDTGFNQLYRICREINKHCTIDKTCGIHVHIGNTLFNKYFVVYAYILGEKLQSDIFNMLPSSRRNNMYCTLLPKLNLDSFILKFGNEVGMDMAYEYLFEKLAIGHKASAKLNKTNPHPGGRYCGRYQDVPLDKILRYCWLNLIPAQFNTRGFEHPRKPNGRVKNGVPLEDTSYTIEFRNHSASLNFEKIKNWILICMAFVHYVNNNKLDILNKKKITVEDLIKSAFDKNSKKLLDYVQERKELFAKGTLTKKSELEKVENEEYKEKYPYKDSIKYKDLICA